VLLTDVLPAGFTYVADTSGLLPTLGAGGVAWSVGTLSPGAGLSLQVALTAAPGTGTMTNTALASTAGDVWPANNSASAITQLAPASGTIRIRDIQGITHLSPYSGTLVAGVTGIVTARRPQSFVMQDPSPDSNPATSEAIVVFTGGAPAVDVGDAVVVTGTVAEFRPGGSGGDANLTLTQISAPTVTRLSSGNALPAPAVIGQGGRVPPTAVIDDDAAGNVETAGTFDAASDGIDFYESLEGMLVQVNGALASGPTSEFGETPVLADGGSAAGVRTARGGIVVSPADFNPERIILDDALIGAAMPAMNVGDLATTPITGVIDYSRGNYRLLVAAPYAVAPASLAPEVAATPLPNEIAVATMNVENLSAQDPITKFARLAGIVVDHLRAPDVIALEEMQDNSGSADDGAVSAAQTFQRLIDAISAAGGPMYQYRQIDPEDKQDGGQPGGNIRVGFLYRTDRGVSFVDRPGANAATANGVVNAPGGPRLLYSPGRIDPDNTAFASSRKPLAAEFQFRGQTVFVIANHWNSKGGDQPLFGRYQPPTLESEAQRLRQAAAVKAFVGQLLAADPNARVIVLGDLNDFEFSAPLAVLKSAGLTALIEQLPKPERYTYVYEGNAQALDHILVSPALLAAHAPALDIVHVNAEFIDQASDHDPQLARFAFGANTHLPIVRAAPSGTP
jgi:predicted extracellular nuclease